MVDFLTQYSTGHNAKSAILHHNRQSIVTPAKVLYLLDRAPESKFEGN